jgi:hypothetical protein
MIFVMAGGDCLNLDFLDFLDFLDWHDLFALIVGTVILR